MNRRIVRAVAAKELLDAARDPRALLYLVGLPLVFYPALLLLLEYVARGAIGGPEGPPHPVPMTLVEEAPALAAVIDEDPGLYVVPSAVPALSVAQGQAAVGIEPLGGFEHAIEAGVRPRLDLYLNRSVRDHEEVRARVDAALARYERALGGGQRFFVAETVLGQSQDFAFVVGLFPYFLVVLILVGAGHMAIDVTAGEKERRTLETLLVSPAKRLEILAGKGLATLAASTGAGIVGMFGFAIAIAIADLLSREDPFLLDLPPHAYWVLGLGSLPSAFFLSALLLSLGTLARSSREGQTYGAYLQMPLLLLALGATYLGPDKGLWIYTIPLLGVNLMQKEYLNGTGEAGHAVVAVGATIAMGVVLTGVAVHFFSKESVLFRA